MNNREAHYYLEELQRMMTQHRDIFTEEFVCANGMAIQALEQERKKGKNICEQAKGHCEFKCSVCGAEIGVVEGGDLDGTNGFNFCPACGAELKGEQGE